VKILIIEDDKVIAEVERDFLKMNGFEVIIEADGKKGLERGRAVLISFCWILCFPEWTDMKYAKKSVMNLIFPS
jgi:CheY-like chemotaxis protein